MHDGTHSPAGVSRSSELHDPRDHGEAQAEAVLGCWQSPRAAGPQLHVPAWHRAPGEGLCVPCGTASTTFL